MLDRHVPGRDLESIKAPSRPTHFQQQRSILTLFDYRLCDRAAKLDLEHKAQRIVRLSTQPISILRELLQYLTQQRFVAPPYTFLQDLGGRAVASERKRIRGLWRIGEKSKCARQSLEKGEAMKLESQSQKPSVKPSG